MKITLIIAFLFTAFNTGLIWTIQLVHYPGFLHLGKSSHHAYHDFHMKAITPLVGTSMLVELASSAALLFFASRINSSMLLWLSLILLGGIWLHTALVAVPLHGKLSTNFDLATAHQLVSTNWWRTLFWSLRAVILTYLVLKMWD